MIADTTFIIDLGRGDSAAFNKLSELKSRKEALAITSVTTFELFQGATGLSEKELKLFSKFVDNSMIVPVEHDAAKVAGIIRSQMGKRGIRLEALDCLIAGVVIAGNDVLLTRNVKDFSPIKGLRLESY